MKQFPRRGKTCCDGAQTRRRAALTHDGGIVSLKPIGPHAQPLGLGFKSTPGHNRRRLALCLTLNSPIGYRHAKSSDLAVRSANPA
jgi:hypothetical protein